METTNLLALILVKIVIQSSGQPNCALNRAVMTCHYEIPKVIPPNVNNVFIIDLNGSLESYTFADTSWKSVTFLDIVLNLPLYDLKAHIFSPLISLKHLGLHQPSFLVMQKQVFAGLENVEVLDLSGCRKLYLDNNMQWPDFYNALSGKGLLPKLNTLNLINVGNSGNRAFLFDADAVRMIIDRNIKSVMFGEQTVFVDFDIYEVWPNPPYNPSPVQSIYASYSVAVMSLQNTANYRLIDTPIFEVLKNLRNVTLSYIDIPSNSEKNKSHKLCRNYGSTVFLALLLYVEEFNLQNTLRPVGDIYDTMDAYECTMVRLKKLTLNNCGIGRINTTCTIPENAYLDEVDLSNNNITYFFIKGNCQSKRLSLSNNNLQKMNNYPEFSQAFVTFTMLEYLHLGRNGLRTLPQGIFSGNKKLKKLFLNENALTSVPKTLIDLSYLKLLDLRHNLIKSLDANAIGDVHKLIKVFNTTVELTMNPFECSCKTTDFVNWISSITNQERIYHCNMEGKTVMIGNETFRDCKFLCYRDILYVGITSLCLVFVFVVILLVVKRYSILQKQAFKKEIQEFITRYLEGNIEWNINEQFENINETLDVQRQKYLVMLAHHNDDKSMCSDNIYDPLHNGLKSLVRTTNDLVFFDKEPPGVSIFAEMETGTLVSCVFVCVVTKGVCKDRMFEIYLNNAVIENKPIVFIICEPVVEVIPLMMKAMLRTAYTVSMYNGDQNPDWNTICKNILNLAVKANRKSDSIFSVKTCLWQTVCTCHVKIFGASSNGNEFRDNCDLTLNEFTGADVEI